MALSDKLKWKRTINQLRFLYEEHQLVVEIAKTGAREFQGCYEDFCERHQIDLHKLNKDNAQKIAGAYSSPPPPSENKTEPPTDTDMVIYEAREEVEEEPYQMSKDELEIHEIFNKLYRRLVLIYHPDKLKKTLTYEERNDMLEIFKEISSAFESRKYFILLDYAEKNNISIPKNYRQQTRWMKKELKTIESETTEMKRTYNYLLGEAETVEEKDNIFRQFIKQLFDLAV